MPWVPPTLIARACSSGSSNETEAPSGHVGGDRAHAVAVLGGVAVQLGQRDVHPGRGGRVVGGADQRHHVAIRPLQPAHEQLAADEARRAREQDGAHAAASAPMAWKPPSTWTISPEMARAPSESR